LDKTLEIIIAASVILLTAGVVMFMVGGQSGDFQNWLNNTQGDAECSLQQTKYENACDCSADSTAVQGEAQQIIAESQQYSWTDDITSPCSDVC